MMMSRVCEAAAVKKPARLPDRRGEAPGPGRCMVNTVVKRSRTWKRAVIVSLLACSAAIVAAPANAQVEVTVFAGRSFPIEEERFRLRAPSVPSLPGVEITESGTPELRVDGGPVFAAALALHAGAIGIEGRIDLTDVGFDVVGANYELRGTEPPFSGLSGRVTAGDGRFDVDRLELLSLNLRLRTPGPVGLVLSGGLSYLPDVTIKGSIPVSVNIEGIALPAVAPTLLLTATPGQSEHRWGGNLGAGIRIGGRVSLVGEARVFYFRSYDLRFDVEDVPLPFLDEILENIGPIRFEPVIVNALAGLSIRF